MRRSIDSLIVTLLAIGLLVAACAGSTGSTSGPTDRASSAPDPLDGTSWFLQSLDGEPIAADAGITLAFSEGSVSGSSGCNTYSGAYQLDGPSVTIGPLAATEMACAEPAKMTIEADYLESLAEVTAWAVPQDVPIGAQLTLTGTGPKLVFGRPPSAS